jgi:serine phosphatase RsbU (regulator of sigma subunit)
MLSHKRIVDDPEFLEVPSCAGDLPHVDASLPPTATNDVVMELFSTRPELHALAVVEAGRPIGLINRNEFFSYFARPFHRDLFLQKTCRTVMNPQPALVAAEASIAEVGAIVTMAGPRGLSDGVVLTKDGRYRGLSEGLAVMRALTAIQTQQHHQLLSSIDYASTIQGALLADSRAALERAFGADHALVWEPRDVVGGDCFFASADERGVLFGLIDCTGHGVPGALLTSIAISETNRLAAQPDVRSHPGALLTLLNGRVKAALNQTTAEAAGEADDGMDAVFLYVERGGGAIRAASAKLPIFVVSHAGELTQVKGSRKGLGYRDTPLDYAWEEVEIPAPEAARIFLATDGVGDQIGEETPMAFGWRRFTAALMSAADAPIRDQVRAGEAALVAWQGREARRDDISILGVRLAGLGA